MCLIRCALSSGKMPVCCTSWSAEIARRYQVVTRKLYSDVQIISYGPILPGKIWLQYVAVRAQIAEGSQTEAYTGMQAVWTPEVVSGPSYRI